LFPRPWIVTTWVPGTPADLEPATRATDSADALAGFLSALHRSAPTSAPAGRGRGGSLAECEEQITSGLAAATAAGLIPDADAVREVWADAVAAPEWTGPRLWLHADLHPANVLTAGGTFCGVIDFGDLCAGDPACDLAAAWVLLPDGAAERFQDAYDPPLDDATLRRARGWALWRALGGILIGDAGRRRRPGGKTSWGPPAQVALKRLTATIRAAPVVGEPGPPAVRNGSRATAGTKGQAQEASTRTAVEGPLPARASPRGFGPDGAVP